MPDELNEYNKDAATWKPPGESQSFYRIFDPAQGYDPNQVLGRQTEIKKISIRGLFQYKPSLMAGATVPIQSNLTDCYVRYIVFVDKQPVLLPEVDMTNQILQDESYAIMSFKNLDWSNRFDFLVDERFSLSPGTWFPTGVQTGDSRAIVGNIDTNYTLYGKLNNAITMDSKVLLDDSVDPPVPYSIKGTVIQNEEDEPAHFDGFVNMAGTEIPYNFKAGLGDPVPIATWRGNGEFAGALEVVAMEGLWTVGATPGTIGTVPGSTWFDGTLEPTGLADIELGNITNLKFDTDFKLPEVEMQTKVSANLPQWTDSFPPDPNTPGLHGNMNSGVQLNLAGRWTGSSIMKEWYIEPKNLTWQKDWNTGKITANDIKVAIIVDTPDMIGPIPAVFTAYFTSRIRYNDK